MKWKCDNCGIENELSQSTCPGCFNPRFPLGVGLISDETGKEIQCRISAVLGGRTLKKLGDSGLKYVSDEQFRLDKKPDLGAWVVTNLPGSKNPTYLNGAPIPDEGSQLKEGDILSIKGKALALTVKFIY